MLTIRPLDEADAEASGRIGREAFGFPLTDQPYRPVALPGAQAYGLFDRARLLARAYDRGFDSWFGGALVPTAGIAGVAIAPEARGRGLLRPLLTEVLAHARDRGAVISGLFPSQAGIYRRMGYELITSLDRLRLPSASVAGLPTPDGVTLRRAEPDDHAAVADLYAGWAGAQNGPLSRTGASFPAGPQEWVSEGDGLSLAERDGAVVGFCRWERGAGVGSEVTFGVTDLIAGQADGYRALLGMIGSFASIAGSVSFETSGRDVWRLLLRQSQWTTTATHPYMIMIMDVAGLLSSLQYPSRFSAQLDFRVAGHLVEDQDGGYRLQVADGSAVCERDESAAGPVLSPQGLAVVVSGAQSCANARSVGLVDGDADDDQIWDALFGGRQVHIRDYY